jgi:hypothetical protein
LRRHVVFAVLSFAACAVPAAAQQAAIPEGRSATVTVGFGNAMGWLGGQGEKYFSGGRLSAFGGIGYVPDLSEEDEQSASGLGVAAGLRGYTPGRVHRGFAELSVSCVSSESVPDGLPADDLSLRYGPGLQIGYQRVSRGGFTLTLSTGVGFVVGETHGNSRAGLMAGIGIGKTWRRK